MRDEDPSSWQYAVENFIYYTRFVDYAAWPAVDLAWVYFRKSKFTEIEPLLAPTLERHPDNPWVLNMYGLAMLNTAENKSDTSVYFEPAIDEASNLSTADWGNVYSGKDPAILETRTRRVYRDN